MSLTITEGGYFIDPATQRFDAAHPDIRADAAALTDMHARRSVGRRHADAADAAQPGAAVPRSTRRSA